MTKRMIGWIAVLAALGAGLATAADSRVGDAGRHGSARGCEPVLPVLFQVLPTDLQGDGIRSCDVITTPRAWAAFCADNGLVCNAHDERFFREWTMVAVVVDSLSPVICENAGQVPGWAVSCLTRRGAMIGARVELSLAGAACHCSMNPQLPVRIFMVDAVPAGSATACRAWPEVHLVECLGP